MLSRAAASRHTAWKGKSSAGAAAGWLIAQGSKALPWGVMLSRAAASAAWKGKSSAGAPARWLIAQGSKALPRCVEWTRALVGGLWRSLQAACRGASARQDSLGLAHTRWSARYRSEALTWVLVVAIAVCVGIATVYL